VPVVRQIAGAAVVVAGLPVLTVALIRDRESLPLATPVLLVLLLVVLAALLGGLRVGIPAALAGGLVLNWFFTVPYGTLVVDRPDQLLVLAVYLAVSVAVSLVVGVAARRTTEATRAKAEAQALSSLAGAALAKLETLPGVLEQIRSVFGVREVALLEYEAGQWSPVETVSGTTPPDPDDTELWLQINPTLALVVNGPALFGEDQRVLRSFAQSAATALEGRRLALRAAAAAQFEAADQMRTALLAAVGHDLRTPLAGVKVAVSSLRQRDVRWTPEETEELLETIENSADRLQYLVANLLDASRLQAGAVSVAFERASLAEVLDRALVTLNRPGHIRTDIPDTLPDLWVDTGLTERVLANILDNALRHTPQDEFVSVHGSTREEMVVCDVIDHGPGVPEHLWMQIFSPFQRFGDRRPGGIGLGLAVARGFTDAMGGHLQPVRTAGGGLTMQLLLPAVTDRGRRA
jgi:two-component system sensor histidine kinase KdpD